MTIKTHKIFDTGLDVPAIFEVFNSEPNQMKVCISFDHGINPLQHQYLTSYMGGVQYVTPSVDPGTNDFGRYFICLKNINRLLNNSIENLQYVYDIPKNVEAPFNVVHINSHIAFNAPAPAPGDGPSLSALFWWYKPKEFPTQMANSWPGIRNYIVMSVYRDDLAGAVPNIGSIDGVRFNLEITLARQTSEYIFNPNHWGT